MAFANSQEPGREARGSPREGGSRAAGLHGESLLASRPTWRALEALVEKYRGRRFEDLLDDPGFRRLSPTGVHALAAEYRRQTKRLRAEVGPQLERGVQPPRGRRITSPILSTEDRSTPQLPQGLISARAPRVLRLPPPGRSTSRAHPKSRRA